MFLCRHPDCTKSSVENLVCRLGVYEQREGSKKKRWFIRKEEIEKLSISEDELKRVEEKKLEIFLILKEEEAKRKVAEEEEKLRATAE